LLLYENNKGAQVIAEINVSVKQPFTGALFAEIIYVTDTTNAIFVGRCKAE